MDIIIKLSVPGYIYRFYQDASRHIANQNTEQTMADALSGYAGLLSEEIARERTSDLKNRLESTEEETGPSPTL